MPKPKEAVKPCEVKFIRTKGVDAFNSPRDLWLYTIACETLRRAICDWHLLEDGKYDTCFYGNTIYKKELLKFFHSDWFNFLVSTVTCYTPKEVREALGVEHQHYYGWL